MDNIKKVPEIRFKGFDEEWEKSALENVAKVYDGTHQTPKYKNHGIMFLSVEDIKTLKSNKFISKEDFIKDFKVYPERGDILMTRIGDIGTSNFIDTDEILAYYVRLALIKPFDISCYYLNYLISSNLFREELNNRTLNTAIPKKINMGEIGKINFYKPTNKEQTQIGTFFKNLDEKLEIEKEKHKKLIDFKKAMLDDMFPKYGEKVPKVRFEGFNDEWKTEIVGNTSVITIGDFVHSSKQNISGLYPVYNGGVSYTGFYNKFNNEANKVIVSARGANAGYVNIVRRRYWAGNSCYSVEISNFSKHNLEFLYQSMKLRSIKLIERQQAANIPSVSKNDVYNLEILFPSPKEQALIGNFFKNLDEKIELSEQKIAKIENFKKAMLDKMFV